MFPTIAQVALGGAIGASGRYLAGVLIVRLFGIGHFPLGIITVNIIGSFLMGMLTVFLARYSLTHFSPFLAVGVLGGFTTFSSFSLEAVTLIERGAVGLAALYVVLSVVISITALFAGLSFMRAIA
ncbi:fluoride efflux transporter CrcB [Qingshengfaniella alkalisoli]|uniref:Fluoride-specific ion channel FluC n=1 Tax=Qingshengfaniella alkalisoli TaxID=2599296 RepID=A0A5B8IWG8_9RHOB|nr:fluoride efflux transporter CrcB [Qingshengfaniella alkalisoli]QDY69863.1 fluoride efflux transporter CrcB [Qingshengfaniella alkalisoli]